MGKKIISFLGIGNYQNTKYKIINKDGDTEIVETRFVQEAVHKIVGKDSILYIGLTGGSKERNWESGIKTIRNFKKCIDEKTYQKGLKDILDENDIEYRELDLKDGASEEEIWENFDRIFNILEEGDELYIDVTHSFRSLPIVIMSIVNYAKFIKNISIKGIYYGAYEARCDNNVAPIFDLSLFNSITDWTIAADKFISTGDSSLLNTILDLNIKAYKAEIKGTDEEEEALTKLKDALKLYSEGLYNVRGHKISEYGFDLKNKLSKVKEVNINTLKPFGEILDRIHEIVNGYSDNLVKDVHYTVELCKELNLIQQAYTFLRENIVNFVCVAGDIYRDNENKFDVKEREIVERIINSKHPKIKVKFTAEDKEMQKVVGKFVNVDLANFFQKVGKLRNDLNHAGYRAGPSKSEKFYKELENCIKDFEEIIDMDNMILKNKSESEKELDFVNKNPKMVLVFSHKLTAKQTKDAKESLNVDEFISLPDQLQRSWSSIAADLEDIDEEIYPIKEFVKSEASEGDYILVQGDFGATYSIVDFSKENGLIPVYSTTRREAEEIEREDGKVELRHLFDHIRFRKY